jgi:hypothetical protein
MVDMEVFEVYTIIFLFAPSVIGILFLIGCLIVSHKYNKIDSKYRKLYPALLEAMGKEQFYDWKLWLSASTLSAKEVDRNIYTMCQMHGLDVSSL